MPFDHDMFSKGYDDGFAGDPSKREDNEDYMSGFRVGSVDRMERLRHLRQTHNAPKADYAY